MFGESGGGYFDTIQKVATQGLNNNNHLEYRSKPGYFPAEVAFVPKFNAQKEDDGYLLFVEYAANRHASDVVILAAETMEEVYRQSPHAIFRTRSTGIGIQMLRVSPS